jgi:hypothetical protein
VSWFEVTKNQAAGSGRTLPALRIFDNPERSRAARPWIGSSDGDCVPSPSHTTGHAVFRIRRLNPAAFISLQDLMA